MIVHYSKDGTKTVKFKFKRIMNVVGFGPSCVSWWSMTNSTGRSSTPVGPVEIILVTSDDWSARRRRLAPGIPAVIVLLAETHGSAFVGKSERAHRGVRVGPANR